MRTLARFFALAICLIVAGCARDPVKTPGIGEPAFRSAIEKLAQHHRLIAITWYDEWQVVVEDRNTHEFDAFAWNGKTLVEDKDSFLITDSMMKNIYRAVVPLEGRYASVTLDYPAAFAKSANWRRRAKTMLQMPLPTLVAMRIDGRIRPVWVLPLAMIPFDESIGVLADDGEVLARITLDERGWRKAKWYE